MQWLTLHGLVTAVSLSLYVATSHVMLHRRNPAAAIAWVFFILLLPYLALPAYLLFGSRKRFRPPSLPKAAGTPAAIGNWAIQTAQALGQPDPADYHALHIHRDGNDARRALFEVLDSATQSIDICTFILKPDELGEAVVDRLCTRAASGIRVRVLLDGFGRLMAGRPEFERLVAAGGSWALFAPPLTSPLRRRSNLRDHRKFVIADGEVGGRLWMGGRNLAAEYFATGPDSRSWRDLTFDLQGPVVCQAAGLFACDWSFAGRVPVNEVAALPLQRMGMGMGAQLIASGPDQADDSVHALLVTAAYRACSRIVLATPYFVPDAGLLTALCLAARRGVSVELLLPGTSNHRLSDLARCRALRAFSAAGGRIWLAPGMLHAKLVLIDDAFALAGSANLDTRSLFINYEAMCAFHDGDAVSRFANWFETERATAREVSMPSVGFMRDIADGLLLWVAFQL